MDSTPTLSHDAERGYLLYLADDDGAMVSEARPVTDAEGEAMAAEWQPVDLNALGYSAEGDGYREWQNVTT